MVSAAIEMGKAIVFVIIMLALGGLSIWLNRIAWIDDPSLSEDPAAYDHVPGGFMTPFGLLSLPGPGLIAKRERADLRLEGTTLDAMRHEWGNPDLILGSEANGFASWWDALRLDDPLSAHHRPVVHLVCNLEQSRVTAVRCFAGGGRQLYPRGAHEAPLQPNESTP
jgi:hypothetical protein